MSVLLAQRLKLLRKPFGPRPGTLPGVEKGPDGLKRGHGVGGEPAHASAEKKEENERRRQEHEV